MIQNQQSMIFSPFMDIYDLVVPKDNLLRKLNDLVDFSFVYDDSAAFTILLLAFIFGGFGSALALFIIRDGFAIFYGMQLGYILLINSVIVFFIAILVTVGKKYNSIKM